jgi:hypothetical protein
MRQALERESGLRGIKSRPQTRERKPSSSPVNEIRPEGEAKNHRQESDVGGGAAVDDGIMRDRGGGGGGGRNNA